MSRDENAPEDLAEDVSRLVDNLRESSANRRRTTPGVDVDLVRREAEIASESRKNRALQERSNRAERWFVLGGATAGFVTLGFELWRITNGR